ncbi:MAG: YHS domain-containing (seleno)protein [Pseudomonadota bacterium]
MVLPVTLCLACAFVSVGALATERIIADPNQQLALFGYDPVAYLADGRARVGAERYEVLYEDLVWRFANEGNLESFLEAPDTFVPAFGGYDAFMIGRGSATPGNPEIFVVVGTRVLLFRDEPARFAFNLEPEFLLARSDEIWPDVRLTLAP